MLVDGFFSMPRGVHTQINPFLLDSQVGSDAVNVDFKDGVPRTRDGFVMGTKKELALDRDIVFRGAGVWSLNYGDFLVVAISQHIFLYDINSDTWIDFLNALSNVSSPVYFVQVDKWLLVQDGQINPFYFERSDSGVITRKPANSLSKGTVGLFVYGRYHFSPVKVPAFTPNPETEPNARPDETAESGRTSLVSSDIMDPLEPERVFRMTEHRLLHLGGAYKMPLEAGFIHALSPFRQSSSGTGNGSVLIFCRNGVFGVDFSIPRAQWKTSGFVQPLFYGVGTRSAYSVTEHGGEVFFLDYNGNIRSVTMETGAYAKGVLASNPLGYSLSKYARLGSLVDRSSICIVDRFLLFTAMAAESWFDALGCFTQLDAQAPFIADGIFTGPRILQCLAAKRNGKSTVFVVAYGQDSKKTLGILWLDEEAVEDLGSVPIESKLVTSFLTFKTGYLKRLSAIELFLDRVKADTLISVSIRPDGSPIWYLLGETLVRVPKGDVQSRRRVSFVATSLQDVFDPVTKNSACLGIGFQVKINWTGWASILRMTAYAEPIFEGMGSLKPCTEDNEERVSYSNVPEEPIYRLSF